MKRGLTQLCLGGNSRIDESLELCRELGYDGLEILLTDEGELNMASTASDYEQLRTWSREIGVELCSICAALSADTSFTSDDPKVVDATDGRGRELAQGDDCLAERGIRRLCTTNLQNLVFLAKFLLSEGGKVSSVFQLQHPCLIRVNPCYPCPIAFGFGLRLCSAVISEVGGDRKAFAETLRRMDRILTL